MSALATIESARPYRLGIITSPSGYIQLGTEIIPPPEVVRALQTHTAGIIAELIAEIARPWGNSASLAAWFLTQHPPARSFEIKPRVTILDPRKFWHALRNDLRAGPEACAGRRETIGRTLKRLYELFYTPAGSAEVTK